MSSDFIIFYTINPHNEWDHSAMKKNTMTKTTLLILSLLFTVWGCQTPQKTVEKESPPFRTIFEETIGVAAPPQLTKVQKNWLVALPAIIMSLNESDPHTLEVEPPSPVASEKWKKVLSKYWGINNRDDLLETLSRMEYSGHNDTFNFLRNRLMEYGFTTVDDLLKHETLSLKNQKYYSFLRAHSAEFEEINLIAWDLGRMTSLIRWGYQVGYISEPEAWNMLVYFGKKIQRHYDSWEDYGKAYSLGRVFWASGFGKENDYRDKTNKVLTKLLDKGGLWSDLKWKQSLPAPALKIFSEEEISTLEDEARTVDQMLNVSARKYKTVYFTLGHHYLRKMDLHKSHAYYTKGLRLDAKDWETQIRMAGIESLLGKGPQASSRLDHLLKNSNDSELLETARKIKTTLPASVEPSTPDNYGKVLLIHPYDYIPDTVLSALMARISQEFRIQVEVGNQRLKLNQKNFRSQEEVLNRMFSQVVKKFRENRKEDYHQVLRMMGLNDSARLTQKDEYEFVKYLYHQSEAGRAAWPELIGGTAPQYNAQVLLRDLMHTYSEELEKDGVLGVLGITVKDIYARDYNFLYGWSIPEGAVMSIHRFYTNGTPLTQIIKRTVNQGFSSTGFILGIPRCTVADCARAYPHNLKEHDEKEDVLCHECRNALTQLYGREQ